MKTRTQFVSNSSSTSFVVVGYGKPLNPDLFITKNNTFVIGEQGCCEFGWENTIYSCIYDRINFAWLQAYYSSSEFLKDYNYHSLRVHDDWMKMLYAVLKEFFQVENIECVLTNKFESIPGYKYAYIDHQSASYEGRNIKIFNDIDTLKQFLFCDSSYIQGGNDNE